MREKWYNYLDNIFKNIENNSKKSETNMKDIKLIAANRWGKTPYIQQCDSVSFNEINKPQ